MAIKSHTFRGLRYLIHHTERISGYAEVPGKEPRGLYVDPEQSPKQLMETYLHEAMHAEDPDITERVIDRRAKSLTNWMWRLGYRIKGE